METLEILEVQERLIVSLKGEYFLELKDGSVVLRKQKLTEEEAETWYLAHLKKRPRHYPFNNQWNSIQKFVREHCNGRKAA